MARCGCSLVCGEGGAQGGMGGAGAGAGAGSRRGFCCCEAMGAPPAGRRHRTAGLDPRTHQAHEGLQRRTPEAQQREVGEQGDDVGDARDGTVGQRQLTQAPGRPQWLERQLLLCRGGRPRGEQMWSKYGCVCAQRDALSTGGSRRAWPAEALARRAAAASTPEHPEPHAAPRSAPSIRVNVVAVPRVSLCRRARRLKQSGSSSQPSWSASQPPTLWVRRRRAWAGRRRWRSRRLRRGPSPARASIHSGWRFSAAPPRPAPPTCPPAAR